MIKMKIKKSQTIKWKISLKKNKLKIYIQAAESAKSLIKKLLIIKYQNNKKILIMNR